MKSGDSSVDVCMVGECWAREIAGGGELWADEGGSDVGVAGMWLGGSWSRGSTTRWVDECSPCLGELWLSAGDGWI